MTTNQGLGTWIDRRARMAPDRVALVFGDTPRTYAELAIRVRRLANHLRSLGVRRGDRVAWIGANHPAFLEILFATAKVGAVLAPINPRLDRAVVEALGEDVGPRVVFLESSMSDLKLPSTVAATVTIEPQDAQENAYERLIAGASEEPIDEPVTLDDLCLLPFTSGTTGTPKGIMLTHGQVTWNAINVLSSIDVRSDDVTVAIAPFFRTGGTGINVLPVLFKGGTVVIPAGGDLDSVFDAIERHRVTIAFGNPDLLAALARSPRWSTGDLSSVRLFLTGGSPVSERLIRTCHERGVNVLQGYGLSEAAPLVSMLDGANALRKVGSAGRPALFVDVRIARSGGVDVPAGQIGELFVRGPNVMAGYWKRPEATRQAIDEHGWLRTGDAAVLDSEGFLSITGRVEDAYVSAGTVVHPGVVERVLLEHPAVAEACVVGTDSGGVAYVVLEPGAAADVEEELWSLCRDRLPVHARPVTIECVPSLPKSPAGKILRHELTRESLLTYR